jgi:hypothetical protein
MPAFMIIGTQRGGTSSMYKYLEDHPDLAASIRKETEYFSRRFGEGESWYRAHFPLAVRSKRLSFEATPDYLFYPPTPRRIATRLPNTSFIVLLRDPVTRAYSQYRHMVRLGFETLEFEEALTREPDRIRGDLAALNDDEMHYSRELLRFSYATRGRYGEQLARWFEHFDRSRFLILRSENLFAHPDSTFDEVVRFLGVRSWRPRRFRNHSLQASDGHTAKVPYAAAECLRETLQSDVEHLESLLGHPMGWTLGGTL